MSYRAAVILIENGRIALVERHRQGQHYFVFPGGHIEKGETHEHAAVRECKEELGLDVEIERLVAELVWQGKSQFYYLVHAVGGAFGTGTGEELTHPTPEKGDYRVLWVLLEDVAGLPLMPPEAKEILIEAQSRGWPSSPIIRRGEG